MPQLYRVLLTGATLHDRSVDVVAADLGRLVGRSPAAAAALLRGEVTTVKTGLELASASRYVAALEAIAVGVRVEPEQVDLLDLAMDAGQPAAATPAPAASVPAPAAPTRTVATPPPVRASTPPPAAAPRSGLLNWRLWLGVVAGIAIGRLFGLVATLVFFLVWWLSGRELERRTPTPTRGQQVAFFTAQLIVSSLTAIAASMLVIYALRPGAPPAGATSETPPGAAALPAAPASPRTGLGPSGSMRDDERWNAFVNPFETEADLRRIAQEHDARFASPAVWDAVRQWQRANMATPGRGMADVIALYVGVNDVLQGFKTCDGGLLLPGPIVLVDAASATADFPVGTALMEQRCRQLIFDPVNKTYRLAPP